MSLSNLGDKLVKWLEASDFDKPYLQPPLDVKLRTQTFHAGLSQKIADMRTAICLLGEVNKQVLDRWAYKVRRNLTKRITSGHVTVEDLILSMEPLDSITWQHIGDDELAQSFTTTVQTYIVSTLGRMRRKDTEDMYLEAWLAIVDKVLSMPAANATFTVLRYLIKESRPSDRHQLSPELLLDASQSFLLTQMKRSTTSSGWLLRFARFAQMLERLNTTQRITIDSGLLAHVLRYSSVTGPEKARDLQYSWLLLQAHFESLPLTAFETTLDGFLDSYGPLDEYEAWQLATARLLATRAVDHDQHRHIVAGKLEIPKRRWTALAVAIQGDDSIRNLCSTLLTMQSSDYLASALVSSNSTKERNHAVRRIISHPDIDHRLIWDAIDRQRKAAMRVRRIGGCDKNKINKRSYSQIRSLLGLVDKMAIWYQTAPSLSSRQAFRGLELCVKAHQTMSRRRGYEKGRVSPAVLAGFTEIIIRDMSTGPGRTERLEFLLRIIAEQRGQVEARRARAVLQGWRQRIHEHSGLS